MSPLIWIQPAAARAFLRLLTRYRLRTRCYSRSLVLLHSLIAMSCQACERMQLGDTVQPHDGLRITEGQTRLRPVGRRPVLLQRYGCRLCNTNWLRELDPLRPEHSDWICLYQASSILDPVSRQGTRSSALASISGRADAERGASPEPLRHGLPGVSLTD
jgi:hypothetical protein